MDWDLPLRKFFSESNQTLPLSITYMDALRQQMEDFLNEVSSAFSLLQNDLVANATTGVVLEPDPFIEVKNKFLENGNVQQRLYETKQDWVNIINRNPKKSEV
jgi:hypothetical protein